MLIKPPLLFYCKLFNTVPNDPNWQPDKTQVLTKSIVKILETKLEILEPKGLKISQCEVLLRKTVL